MSTTLLRSAMPRRFASLVVAGLFGLTLAVNPVAAPKADAAISIATGARVVRVVAAQAGIRYLYGGTTRRGFDCSGLTQYVFAKVGKHIPRTAQAQYNASKHKARAHIRPGDLVFFYSANRRQIYHVGIFAGQGYMWHSPKTGSRVKKVKIWTNYHVVYGRVR